LTIPSWLNPWWRQDFEVTTAMTLEAARAALSRRTGRLRGRFSPDAKSLVLVRRGGLMNEFVHARVELMASGSGTTARVHIARPTYMSAFMTLIGLYVLVGPAFNVLVTAVTRGISVAIGWLIFVPIGLAIYAAVMGMNYTSARSEAKDLRALITAALDQAAPVSP
jgi:hypothetical protein